MGAKVSVTATEVSVSNKGHSELPYSRSAREFTKLKQANFSRNNISRFPKQLSPDIMSHPPIIDTLIELDLSSNELETLPDEICLLVSLKKLRLEGNRISRLPANFPGLYKLEKLYLNDNELRELPVDMANLENLKVLRLHNNRLHWIPNDVGKIRLSELTIHENPLREDLLELSELEEVLSWFRGQESRPTYVKALKQHLMGMKIRDGLHELKEARLHAFRVILSTPEVAISFEAFLEKEFAIENLQFYRETDAFRSRFSSNFPIVSKELRDAGLVLYQKYIEEAPADVSSEQTHQHKVAINIPISVKKKLDEAFAPGSQSPPDQWVFADAYVAITKLMFEDSFKRFQETPEGKRIWTQYYEEPAAAPSKRRGDRKKVSINVASEPKKRSRDVPDPVSSDEEASD